MHMDAMHNNTSTTTQDISAESTTVSIRVITENIVSSNTPSSEGIQYDSTMTTSKPTITSKTTRVLNISNSTSMHSLDSLPGSRTTPRAMLMANMTTTINVTGRIGEMATGTPVTATNYDASSSRAELIPSFSSTTSSTSTMSTTRITKPSHTASISTYMGSASNTVASKNTNIPTSTTNDGGTTSADVSTDSSIVTGNMFSIGC